MPLFTVKARRRCLAGLLLVAVGCATGTEAPDDWTTRALHAINQARLQQGQAELQWASEMQAIALTHSQDMAQRRQLSHAGFQARFGRTTSLLCVENVAAGTISPATLVAAWSRAPVHRRNLHEPRVRNAGIAEVQGYVTLFACE